MPTHVGHFSTPVYRTLYEASSAGQCPRSSSGRGPQLHSSLVSGTRSSKPNASNDLMVSFLRFEKFRRFWRILQLLTMCVHSTRGASGDLEILAKQWSVCTKIPCKIWSIYCYDPCTTSLRHRPRGPLHFRGRPLHRALLHRHRDRAGGVNEVVEAIPKVKTRSIQQT